MTAITYRDDATVTPRQLAALFRASGLPRPVDDPERLQYMIDHADYTLTAWDRDTLVGIARTLTDFRFTCYLSDLAIHADHQRSGIGKELVRRLRERFGEEVMLLLLATPEAIDYYPRLGFEKADNAYLIKRAR